MSNHTLCCRSPARLFVALLLVTAACNRDVAGPRRVNVASAAWPNEPAGFTVLTDEPFNALNENGWQAVQSQTTNGSGLSLAADAGAPQSPSSVLEFKYAAGFVGGSEPGVEYYAPAAPVRETYFAFWWKPSDPWQNHPTDVNTITDLFAATSGVIFIQIDGSNNTISVDPKFAGDTRDLTPNVQATPMTLQIAFPRSISQPSISPVSGLMNSLGA